MMKSNPLMAIIASMFILASAANAEHNTKAVQWVCPLVELLELGNGESEYYCEECTGTYDYYILATGTLAGDCSDSNKTNCFTQTSSRAAPKIASDGMPDYLRKTPKVKNGGTVLRDFHVKIGKQKFRLFLLSYQSNRIGAAGYEVPADSDAFAEEISPNRLEKTSRHTADLPLGSVRYRLVFKRRTAN